MGKTAYTDCMSNELKGKLAGKSKSKREALFKAAAKKCSGKTGKAKVKSKPKPKAKPKERTRTTTPKKKDTPKKRRRGPLERKAITYYAELHDIARALRIPVSKAIIRTGKTATTVTVGRIIRVKRKKLSDAMREVRKRAKARI